MYSVSNFPLHLLTIKRAFYVRYDVHAISSTNLFMESNWKYIENVHHNFELLFSRENEGM